jgi:hypothetical protein
VLIGGVPVVFPTKVTDAAWSLNGSLIAFIDGDGNLASAHADGSGYQVLVKPKSGSTLSGPAWEGGVLNYVETSGAGVPAVRWTGVRPTGYFADQTYAMTAGGMDVLADTEAPSGGQTVSTGGTESTLVFQHKGQNGPEVWVQVNDSVARGGADPATKLVDGSWPAFGAGGIAFVGKNGQIELVGSHGAAQPTPVTTAAQSPTHLAWTPDGKSIAYSTPTGIEEVAVGRPGAAPTQLSAKPGVVSFLPAAASRIVRYAGSDGTDLVGASIAVSRGTWVTQASTPGYAGGGPTGPYARTVTLIPSDVALGTKAFGSPTGYGPTLLIGTGSTLDPRLADEIKRVLGTPFAATGQDAGAPNSSLDAVYIAADTKTVPAAVDAAIAKLGYTPKRISGTGSTAPAAGHIAVVDTGDAAALSAVKAQGWRTMVSDGGHLSAADTATLAGMARTYLTPAVVAFDDSAYAAAVAALPATQTVTRQYGLTPADFVASVALSPVLRGYQLDTTVTVVPADSPADQLLANLAGVPVVTVDPAQGICATLKALLQRRAAMLGAVDVVDTNGKLNQDTVTQLGALISGPLGYSTVSNPLLK